MDLRPPGPRPDQSGSVPRDSATLSDSRCVRVALGCAHFVPQFVPATCRARPPNSSPATATGRGRGQSSRCSVHAEGAAVLKQRRAAGCPERSSEGWSGHVAVALLHAGLPVDRRPSRRGSAMRAIGSSAGCGRGGRRGPRPGRRVRARGLRAAATRAAVRSLARPLLNAITPTKIRSAASPRASSLGSAAVSLPIATRPFERGAAPDRAPELMLSECRAVNRYLARARRRPGRAPRRAPTAAPSCA